MNPIVQTAVILTGGLGTRLGALTANTPKPLLPVQGRPFLDYVIANLVSNGIRRIVLAAGFRSEKLEDYARSRSFGATIVLSTEQHPLGTGGAIVHALPKFDGGTSTFLVVNGDTFSVFSLRDLAALHAAKQADVTMILKSVHCSSRYGTVEISPDWRVKSFSEKGVEASGLINAGVYLIRGNLLNEQSLPEKFSFETDFLQARRSSLGLFGLPSSGYFIDMGIPSDYERAERELSAILARLPSAPSCS